MTKHDVQGRDGEGMQGEEGRVYMCNSVIGYYHEDRRDSMKIYEDVERLIDKLRGWANEPNGMMKEDCESEYCMQEGRIDAWGEVIVELEKVMRGEF